MSTVQLLAPVDRTQSNERILEIGKATSELELGSRAIDSGELRARILSFGVLDDASVSPTTALACALSIVHPANLAELLAKQLMDRFGSVGAVLSASHDRIQMAIPHSDITFIVLKTVQSLSSISLREKFERNINLGSYFALRDYLRSSLAHKEVEVVRLLLMDMHHGLIRDDLHTQGTVNRVSVSPRDIAKRILEVGAHGLIIVHNHPSGDPKPSADDVEMTKNLEQVLGLFGVTLHDSIIVGRYACHSLKLNRPF